MSVWDVASRLSYYFSLLVQSWSSGPPFHWLHWQYYSYLKLLAELRSYLFADFAIVNCACWKIRYCLSRISIFIRHSEQFSELFNQTFGWPFAHLIKMWRFDDSVMTFPSTGIPQGRFTAFMSILEGKLKKYLVKEISSHREGVHILIYCISAYNFTMIDFWLIGLPYLDLLDPLSVFRRRLIKSSGTKCMKVNVAKQKRLKEDKKKIWSLSSYLMQIHHWRSWK